MFRFKLPTNIYVFNKKHCLHSYLCTNSCMNVIVHVFLLNRLERVRNSDRDFLSVVNWPPTPSFSLTLPSTAYIGRLNPAHTVTTKIPPHTHTHKCWITYSLRGKCIYSNFSLYKLLQTNSTVKKAFKKQTKIALILGHKYVNWRWWC